MDRNDRRSAFAEITGIVRDENIRLDFPGPVRARVMHEPRPKGKIEELRALLATITAWPYRLSIRPQNSWYVLVVENDCVDSSSGLWTTFAQYTAIADNVFDLDRDYFIWFVHNCVLERAAHEVNEFFKVDGVAKFHPHKKQEDKQNGNAV